VYHPLINNYSLIFVKQLLRSVIMDRKNIVKSLFFMFKICHVCLLTTLLILYFIPQRLMDYINSHPELKAKVCGLIQLA